MPQIFAEQPAGKRLRHGFEAESARASDAHRIPAGDLQDALSRPRSCVDQPNLPPARQGAEGAENSLTAVNFRPDDAGVNLLAAAAPSGIPTQGAHAPALAEAA